MRPEEFMAWASRIRMAEQRCNVPQCLSGTIPPHPRQPLPVPASRPALLLRPLCPARSPAHAVQLEAWLALGILLALSELQLLNETHAQQRPGVLPLSFPDKLAAPLQPTGGPSMPPRPPL